MRNVLTRVPKSAEALVATTLRTIFQQPSAEAVHAQHARVVEQLEPRFPEAAPMLDEAAAEVLAFVACPVAHWKQVWSNNPEERLNREIPRRTDVVGIFPNRAALVRLVGAVLAEQHDEWAVARRYMTMVTLLLPPERMAASGEEVLLMHVDLLPRGSALGLQGLGLAGLRLPPAELHVTPRPWRSGPRGSLAASSPTSLAAAGSPSPGP